MEIVISSRCYNGDIGIGSILECKYSFCLKGEKSYINAKGIIMVGDSRNEIDNIDFKIQVPITQKEESELKEIIENIKINENFKYNPSHYAKDMFDFNMYSYDDIIINGEEYEIKKDNEILKKLKALIKCVECQKRVKEMQKELMFKK